MRVVVTGREGQVARSLIERGSATGHVVVPLGRPALDLAGDPDAIVEAIEGAHPDVVVSAAAYTAVDKAESEPDLAFAVNERGAGAVARAARTLGVPLVHLSTDYVFDGTKPSPYHEWDAPNPQSVYGRSKWAGEQEVSSVASSWTTVRISWVCGQYGNNMVKTVLKLAAEGRGRRTQQA